MRAYTYRSFVFLIAIMGFGTLYGQNAGGGGSILLYSLIGVGVILLVWISLSVTDNLLQIEAVKRGVDTRKNNFSIYPRFNELLSSPTPGYLKDGKLHLLKKGHDILLAGEAPADTVLSLSATRYAVRPVNFRGIAPIPKLLVEEGQEVKAGDPVFFDKSDPAIQYVAPVSGEIVEVRRGSKRSITDIVILADKEVRYKEFKSPDIEKCTREELVNFLAESGLWVHINSRPFDVVPKRDDVPRDVFISTFDTAPLAVTGDLLVKGKEEAFHKGLHVLGRLTTGKVYLGLSANGKEAPSQAFTHAKGVEIHWFKGPHPSGNVGVQIHHIAPIRMGDTVWTLKVESVIAIGEMFLTGHYQSETIVSICGGMMKKPQIIRTYQGANIGDLLNGQDINLNHSRLISGNVLTGRQVGDDDFLDIHVNNITAIKEGNYHEMFGWLLPIKPRPSVSKTFPNFLFPGFRFDADTNTHGERRAFVMTGQYEAVLPMNIYVQHVMKAIMTNDYERMEGLGLVELTEEDVALCEFVCTSKMPLQNILRQGLDMMREQS